MKQLISLRDFEVAARNHLSTMAHGYYASGSDDEITLNENRTAYQRIQLRPRMMRGVRERDTRTTLFGQKIAAPISIAPMAFMKLADPAGEIAVARAAGQRGMLMTLSTMSTTPMEDVAQTGAYPRWYQLYVYRDREVTRDLVARAEKAGYQALCVTVDVPLLGKREADIRNGFHLPRGIEPANINISQARASIQAVGNESGLAAHINEAQDDNLTWDDLAWLASITSLPVLAKGVLRGDDARLAVEHGAKGIVVSNHGGRQLDTAVAGIDALPEIVAEVGGEVEILVDGGIRRGTDILKALALGARAVMVGRPVLWGLAVGGEAGVGQVLDILHTEFDHAMAQCGCHNVQEITPDLIYPRR